MNKDYYKILGVEKNATDSEIRKAFLKLSKTYHPDMQSGKSDVEKKEAEEKFKEINEANEVLSDKNKRQRYDSFGSEGINSNSFGFGAGGINPREFFRRAHNFGGFGSFDSMFGGDNSGPGNNTPPNPNSPKDGRDVQITVKFDLEDILYGAKREFTITINDPCEHCHGTGAENGNMKKCPLCDGSGIEISQNGFMMNMKTCRNCHGSGYVAENQCHHCNGSGRTKNERKMSINIPKGITIGKTLRVANEGERGVNGGKNGDIFIIVDASEHEIFKIHDCYNLVTDVYISPVTAIVGGTVDVQTPWGIANLIIKPGLKSGSVFKLSEKGFHTNDVCGDLYVKVSIETPTNITKEQEKLLHKFENTITDSNMVKMKELKDKYSKFRDRVGDKKDNG